VLVVAGLPVVVEEEPEAKPVVVEEDHYLYDILDNHKYELKQHIF